MKKSLKLNENNFFKNTKGISLIVLVITIIVIIILAVAVILSIANNNPIYQAKNAVDDNNISTLKEAAETLKADWIIAKETGNAYSESLVDYIKKNLSGSFSEKDLNRIQASGQTDYVLLTKADLDIGVNAPVYNTSSMIPVYFDNSGNVFKADSTNENHSWYNYTETDKKWANVVTVSSSKRQDYLNADVGTQISYDDINGMFVWIPRYAYSIGGGAYKTVTTNTTNKIDIKFLVGTSDVDYNLNKYPRDYDETKLSAGDTTPMIVHPAFTNNTSMGGWDKELPGIWVAKYESSSSNPSASYGGGNVTNLDVVIKPTDTSWRNITVNNIFTVCRNMEKSNNIYGLTSSDEPHMLKNSEWGAIAYMCASKYGKVPAINSNSSFKPKAVGINSSSTGNEYGIYDLNGGAWEYVAAYYDNGSQVSNDKSLIEADPKYKNVYSVSTEEKNNAIVDTVANNGKKLKITEVWGQDETYNIIRRRLAMANYNLLSTKKGDATYECIENNNYSYTGKNSSKADVLIDIKSETTTAYLSNWDQDITNIGFCTNSFISRGGNYSYSSGAGVFHLNFSTR